MGADFSRVRLDPLLDYAGVELKQGGVLLDGDANELVAIIDRRFRALASDALGRSRVSSTTADAFKITAAGGTLQIGRGRFYVDGLLAECHGADDPAKREFDDLLAETRFADGVDFKNQPYLRDPPALPTGGQHLVYLDVWDREVTHFEQPDLVEIAVGVETSSRRQTVWQVKLLSEGVNSGTTCGSDLVAWDDLIAPSTGRLTTDTYEVAAVDDPCELPPTGGYRGLENQLYRVEIHDGGQPGGTATFKWSRENASVGSRVASMVSATELELESLGRDDVLRFKTGDWVEIINDNREFAQKPGEIRRITVTEATNRISFAGALPIDLQPQPANFPNSAYPAGCNLQVTLWNHGGQVFRTNSSGPPTQIQDLDAAGSNGVIKVPAAGIEVLLESGITVKFDTVGGDGFKPGDYWVFAARTADASVEILDKAPPRGIHHHYARLAIWDAASGAVTDCRPGWPTATGDCDCACTLCVTPESHAEKTLTIQDAVDKLRDSGGTICLTAGSYMLDGPVRISRARSIRITGQGGATMIGTAETAFYVEQSTGISIDSLLINSLAINRSAISVRTAYGLTLRQLVIFAPLAPNDDARGAAIALSGFVAGVRIEDNLIVGADGVRALEPEDEKSSKGLLTAAMGIDNNVFLCRDTAVKFDGLVGHAFETRVIGNQIIGASRFGISFSGVAFPGASLRIDDNNLQVERAGIRCATGGLWIEGNKLLATGGERMDDAIGIQLANGQFDQFGIDQAQLLANQIAGFREAGISVDAPVEDLIIKLNIIRNCGNGILVTGSAKAESVAIDNNQLRDIGMAPGVVSADKQIVGIGLVRTEVATVAGNILRRIGLTADGATSAVAGILAVSVARARIIGNEITEVGPEEFGNAIAGILMAAPYRQAEISDNHVDRDAESNLPFSRTTWYALNIQQPIPNRNIMTTFGNFRAMVVDDNRILAMDGSNAWVSTTRAAVNLATGASAPPRQASAMVMGNSFAARGSSPAVDIAASGDILFNNNRCELRMNQINYAVQLVTPVAIITGNRVVGGEASIHVPLSHGVTTAMGNITTGPITADIPAPMAAMNLIG